MPDEKHQFSGLTCRKSQFDLQFCQPEMKRFSRLFPSNLPQFFTAISLAPPRIFLEV
jgi:hypothetical protein